jgi:hypothetical protein
MRFEPPQILASRSERLDFEFESIDEGRPYRG